MAISSASTRIFKAEDPVMETDLNLLAKVNEYQQDKFDQGEKGLQDEVNNWSMLSQVAKPQDKEYINGKLNKLVSGINNLGGVNLADPNNVNALKSLGYNMYGDDKVMNPVITTRKMQQLAQDINTKTNGKNAKDYDSVYGEYLQNQYGEWLNDGQQGTSFNGPTSLPQGSFDNYNKKVSEALSKLQPDINESPKNDKDGALNYYQVGDKFIKKYRVTAAIDAVTSEQDKNVLSAHAWKSMKGYSDDNVIQLQKKNYDSNIKDMQDNYNFLQYQKSLTTDFQQKQLFTNQMEQLKSSIGDVTKQKSSLPVLQPGQELPKEVRQGISDNLFYNSFKDQYSTARAYDQKKIELKSNSAAIANIKMAQEDFWHSKNYDIAAGNYEMKKKEFGLKEKEFELKYDTEWAKLYGFAEGYGGVKGPAQKAPLSVAPVRGKDDATVLDNTTITQADANFTSAAKNFYEGGYDYLMNKDSTLYGNYLKQASDGHWVPKDLKSSAIVNKGLESFVQMYGNIANMSVKERNGLTFNNDDLDLFERSKDLEEAGLYKNQIKDVTSDVFRQAGLVDPEKKIMTIRFKNGTSQNISYAKLKEMADKEPKDKTGSVLEGWRQNAEFGYSDEEKVNPSDAEKFINKNRGLYNLAKKLPGQNPIDKAISTVNDYYNQSEVKKGWENISKTLNPWARTITLPKQKNGKLPDIAAKVLADNITDQDVKKDIDLEDVDLNKVWSVYDAKNLSTKYMGEIRYRKATKGKDTKENQGDKYTIADLTNVVNQQHENGGGWLSNLYAHDNASIVFGLSLQNEGKTPFDPKTNYEGALQTHGQGLLTHKYQIISVPDPKTRGVNGYKVSVAIPLGKDASGNPKFQVMQVPNFLQDASGKTTIFPANFEGVRAYMESAFKDDASSKDFYQRLGIPYNQ